MKAYHLIFLVLVVANNLAPSWAGVVQTKADNDEEWWKTASLYQIYPRSFMDSDDNGIGDLKGITSRLEHLKELGITAFWLNPIFASPLIDVGYDISDFREILPAYGTMADFDALIAKATELGIGVLLDFVPNHSSDQHDWFKKSILRETPYTDYYVWHDGRTDDNGVRMPPNNWISVFGGSAWEWNAVRNQYYLHQFYKEQPDLNYRNERVVTEMNEVFLFWLRKGLSGFRIDATNHLFENKDFPNEEPSGFGNAGEYEFLIHDHTKDQPECYEMVYNWRKILDDYAATSQSKPKILITEAFTSMENTMKYYQSANGTKGSHFPYNSQLMYLNKDNINADHVKGNIEDWLQKMPSGHVADWPIGSHDESRPGTRVGANYIGIMNILNMLLPGASITYYGDEIGMVDNLALESNEEKRDKNRTPMQWDNTTSAGFSKNAETWLPIPDTYKTVNVQSMKDGTRNHYHHYKELVELRKEPTFMHGQLEMKVLTGNILTFSRIFEDDHVCAIAVNFGPSTRDVSLTDFAQLKDEVVIKSSVALSKYRIDGKVNKDKFTLDGYDGIVVCNSANQIFKFSIIFVIVALKMLVW